MKRAEELKLRIENLVMILVGELKGKKKEEIEAKLQEDIEALSKCDTPNYQFAYCPDLNLPFIQRSGIHSEKAQRNRLSKCAVINLVQRI